MNMLETTWNYQSDHDSPTFHQLLSSRLFWKILFQSTGIFSCSSSLGSGRLLMPRSITIDTRRWCWWNVINTISKQIQIRWPFLNQTSFVATTHVLHIGDVSKMRYIYRNESIEISQDRHSFRNLWSTSPMYDTAWDASHPDMERSECCSRTLVVKFIIDLSHWDLCWLKREAWNRFYSVALGRVNWSSVKSSSFRSYQHFLQGMCQL